MADVSAENYQTDGFEFPAVYLGLFLFIDPSDENLHICFCVFVLRHRLSVFMSSKTKNNQTYQ